MKSSFGRNKKVAAGVAAIGFMLVAAGILQIDQASTIAAKVRQKEQAARSQASENDQLLMQYRRAIKEVAGSPAIPAKNLQTVIPEDVQWLHRAGPRYGIKYDDFSLAHGRVFGGAYNRLGYKLSTLGQPLPFFRGLKVEDVSIGGEWRSLADLVTFLRATQQRHMAIRSLTVGKYTFTATIGVIGE